MFLHGGCVVSQGGLCHPVQAPQALTTCLYLGSQHPNGIGVFLSCTPCINKKNFCFPCEPAQPTPIPHLFVALETLTAREGTEYWGWGCDSPTMSPIPGRWHRDEPRVGCKQGETRVEVWSMSCIAFKPPMIHRQRKSSSLYINSFY